jgi:hypothetical protein
MNNINENLIEENQNQVNLNNIQPQNENNKTNPLTNNQLLPIVFEDNNKNIYIDTKYFKINSILIKCPYCSQIINTKTVKSFKKKDLFCMALLFCVCLNIYCTAIGFIGFKGIKSKCKDFFCFDVQHFCPSCEKLIYSYESP